MKPKTASGQPLIISLSLCVRREYKFNLTLNIISEIVCPVNMLLYFQFSSPPLHYNYFSIHFALSFINRSVCVYYLVVN